MNRAVRGGDRSSTQALRRQGVVRALEAMRLRLADQVSLEFLARTAAMSRFHFARVFHQTTGLAPLQFLSALRLVRARELVLDTDASIAAICFAVGYNSIGTFTRRFTASIGVSPMQLRRRFKEEEDDRGPKATAGPGVRRAGCGASVIVHCHGVTRHAQIFAGAFPSPVPIGRPSACGTAMGITTAGATTMVLHGVPPGRHHVLCAARPVHGSGGRVSDEMLVGVGSPTPVRISSDGQQSQEVTVQLRAPDVTDPPLVSFLPLLFHESGRCMALDIAAPRGRDDAQSAL